MSFEQPRAQRNEPEEPELHERLDNLELRVHKLVGETKMNLQRIPGGEELASTAEGQSKLLKIQESARRFNQRVLGVAAMINTPTVFTGIAEGIGKHMGADWEQTLDPLINMGGRITATSLFTACVIMSMRTMKMYDQAEKTLNTMERKS
ncbi:hypothetical protein HY970_00850 [Candidatus Kaiserbacteria bacterium]|nr:hypothetical protein [Candidatus Kaiserbacteria bacterium]